MSLYPKQVQRWLRAIEIATILFEEEGYHSTYLEDLSEFIRRETVYSPKIREDLVPILYKAARSKRVPMTKLVNGIIEDYLEKTGVLARGAESHEGKNQVGRFPEGKRTGVHRNDP